jgi:hypothetical protein
MIVYASAISILRPISRLNAKYDEIKIHLSQTRLTSSVWWNKSQQIWEKTNEIDWFHWYVSASPANANENIHWTEEMFSTVVDEQLMFILYLFLTMTIADDDDINGRQFLHMI